MKNQKLTKKDLIWDKDNGGYRWIDTCVKMMKDSDIDVDVDNYPPVNTNPVRANYVSHQSSYSATVSSKLILLFMIPIQRRTDTAFRVV